MDGDPLPLARSQMAFQPTAKELVMHELPILVPILPPLPVDSQVTLPEWQLALLAGDDN
jgi:hypothetical protein